MPILLDIPLHLTLDQVLLAQGADPKTARERSPRLVETASQALALGQPLIQPAVAYQMLKVKAVQHERILLSIIEPEQTRQLKSPYVISGKPMVRLLASAKQVCVMVCSIGGDLEGFSTAMLAENPPLGLALDALGSAAVQALVEAACAHFGMEAEARDWQATLPFSPGMDGWPSGNGQAQVFAALDGVEPLSAQIGVSLSSMGMMSPLKSVSAVIGLGPDVDSTGRVCDYCSVRNSCRYQDSEYRI